MKILVVDDTQLHLDAAKYQLGSANELVLSSTFNEARQMMWDREHGKFVCDFDVVLTDFLMPAEKHGLEHSDEFRGQQMPYGLILALIALTASPTVKVVVASAGVSHHDHPMAWAVDTLNNVEFMGRFKLLISYRTNAPTRAVILDKPCPHCDKGKRQRVDGSTYDCVYCDGIGKEIFHAKDWAKILDDLLAMK